MMQQFFQIKQQHPDKILFYRMGDFYEMFGDDAVIASKILQIQLTSRNKNKEDSIPLCGVPVHAYDQYLNKLTGAGYKVAVCEQTEDPAQAKGLVKREVVRIITPGTIVSPDLLDATSNCFLAALCFDSKKNQAGIAFCDLSTGEFEVDQLDLKTGASEIVELLYLYKPREILVSESDERSDTGIQSIFFKQAENLFSNGDFGTHFEPLADFNFELRAARRSLKDHFRVSTLDGFGIETKPLSIRTAGAILAYLKETQKDTLKHINRIRQIQKDQQMILDESTIRNLELFETLNGFEKKNTLVHLLDKCKTAMGSRKLKRWMAAPLLKKDQIEERLDAVQSLIDSGSTLEKMRLVLSQVGDLERIIARISMPSTSVNDLVRLRSGLEPLEQLNGFFKQLNNTTLHKQVINFDDLKDLYQLLKDQILDDPTVKLKDGGFIRQGINKKLDKLKNLMKNGKQLIANMEADERQKTGITSLKIGFNKVFGYYIEVSNASKHLVPDSYIRRQTLVNNERYVTEELKELEEEILSAEEDSRALELKLFNELKQKLQAEISRIQKSAQIVATVDVLSTFSFNAKLNNYNRPELDDNPNRRTLTIKEGRHPVIESLDFEEPFIPNDVVLDSRAGVIMVITGPNMGGKSTYMRQTALIALMAQIGSFVPAEDARLPIFDRIFTRVGASDNLTRGQSTFMVEMSEAASILNNASKDSFIILDEIGRGTSTFDGISIAWAIIEYLHEIKALTLFATHYHELILLEQQLEGVCNAKVVVHEEDDNMVFLRKIVSGETDKSYGIQVAKLAGLPQNVVDRAKEVIQGLKMAEKKFSDLETGSPLRNNAVNEQIEDNFQMSFLPPEEPWMDDIRKFDINKSTPLDALELINYIQKKI
ncbi:MAG: DNA mismatch repair protein MutS [Proteobacteria bacterium]|nr:DNA mismatch repair protein MutS [Pseudomonadota bacterium]